MCLREGLSQVYVVCVLGSLGMEEESMYIYVYIYN